MTSSSVRRYRVHLTDLDIHTRVLESGTGIPIVFLHGNPDNAEEWLPVMAQLGDRYRCIAPDLPGYGESPEPPTSFGYGVQEQVAFVDAFLKAVNVTEKAVLVVHDIGGVMGAAWAGANYSRLKGLLITNTVAFEGFKWFPLARIWGDESPRGKFRASVGMFAIGLGGGALFKRVFGKQNPELSQEQLDRFAKSFALNSAAKNTTLRHFRVMTRPDFFAGYERLLATVTSQVPCRVLWGARDPYVPRENASRFAQATVTVLDDQGHWLPLTAPELLASAIADLCNETGKS
jgi:pimeloyl-ACP methyl ester carboxylesterase